MSVRLSVIGCGAAARRLHLPALRHTGADVVCFASRTRASAEAAAGEWGSGDVVDDWRKAVERDDVDAVIVCAPNVLHAEIALTASGAGKHVLVEKPIATTLRDADRMIAAAEASGTMLVPAHNARFTPAVVACRDAARHVGTVTGFEATLCNTGPLAWSPSASWFLDPALSGGGALLDLGVHVADILRVILGDDLVTVLSCEMHGEPVEHGATARLVSAAGVEGTLRVSWDSPAPEVALSVTGRDASFEFNAADGLRVRAADGDLRMLPLPDPQPEPYAGFVRACEGSEPPPVTAADGRAALAVVRAAALSGRVGRAIAVGEEDR